MRRNSKTIFTSRKRTCSKQAFQFSLLARELARSKLFNSLGQSLIEVVVSAGIAVLLTTALITTALITQKSARTAKNNAVAIKLAQESIEKIRVYRDRNGFDALTLGRCYILVASDPSPLLWELQVCVDGEVVRVKESRYLRKIAIDNSAASNNKLVTVTVHWDEPDGKKLISSQTILSEWN